MITNPSSRLAPHSWLFTLAIAVLAGLAVLQPAVAHELRPAIVTAEVAQSGAVDLRITLNLEAQIAGIGPEHTNTAQSDNAPTYDRLRAANPDTLRSEFQPLATDLLQRLRLAFDGQAVALTLQRVDIPAVGDVSIARVSTVVLSARAPAMATTLTWSADDDFGDNVIRITRAGETEPLFAAFLQAGEASPPISLEGVVRQHALSSFVNYVGLGFVHIVPKGFDHILFVIGLFLLSPHLGALARQVTAFTLAHSFTLALGVIGLINVPAAIVEPLIAASIAFVAVENLFTDRLQRWRPFVVFAFGLLHGLGFAGVLAEIGLPRSDFLSALIGFNIGVELGQLAIVAACFLGLGIWFRHRHWYRQAITMPASIAIACVAVMWVVQRTL